MTDLHLAVFVIVEQQNIALLFSNYLKSLGIVSDVLPTSQLRSEADIPDNQFAILCDADKVDTAREEFARFIKNPYHQRYQQAAWDSGELVNLQKSRHEPGFVDHLLRNAGIFTLTIIAVNLLVFLTAYFGYANELFALFRFAPDLSEPWRLLTPAVFHFSLLHLVFNTLWWWMLGGQLEKKLGTGALLNLFLFSALTSNAAQYLETGPNFGGLSGVVYALLGFTWWTNWLSPQKGLYISNAIVGFMLVWLVIGFIGILPMNVANTAHLVGLVSGCALAYLNRDSKSKH